MRPQPFATVVLALGLGVVAVRDVTAQERGADAPKSEGTSAAVGGAVSVLWPSRRGDAVAVGAGNRVWMVSAKDGESRQVGRFPEGHVVEMLCLDASGGRVVAVARGPAGKTNEGTTSATQTVTVFPVAARAPTDGARPIPLAIDTADLPVRQLIPEFLPLGVRIIVKDSVLHWDLETGKLDRREKADHRREVPRYPHSLRVEELHAGGLSVVETGSDMQFMAISDEPVPEAATKPCARYEAAGVGDVGQAVIALARDARPNGATKAPWLVAFSPYMREQGKVLWRKDLHEKVRTRDIVSGSDGIAVLESGRARVLSADDGSVVRTLAPRDVTALCAVPRGGYWIGTASGSVQFVK